LWDGQITEIYGDEISDAFDCMPYADAVLKEIMRLHPTVGAVARRALKSFDLGSYHIIKVGRLAVR
jgi:cytochrome P450